MSKINFNVNNENINPLQKKQSSSSFYFKQRNCKLDLRSITNVDIDRIIRDVDLDTLQSKLEQITFSELHENDLKHYTDQQIVKLFRISQLVIEYLLFAQERLVVDLNSLSSKYNDRKKSLLRKRRELESLKESCQELKSQVKSKKGNIETLESLLKGAVINNQKQYEDIVQEEKTAPIEKPLPKTDTKPAVAHFYVSGPDGLCIEFKEHWGTYISDIIIDFRRRYPNCKKDEDIKLINRGRILLNDNTIEESDIKCGDNLIVRIDKPEAINLTETPPKNIPNQHEVQNVENKFVLEVKELTTSLVSEMMKGYGKQQENINGTLIEMRRGWESALKSLATTQQQLQQQQQQQPIYVPLQQPVVSEKFDDKVYKALESSVINKLTTQIEEQEKEFEKQLQAAVTSQKSVQIGDIESDTEDDSPKMKYEAILNSMQSEIKELKSIVETVAKKTEIGAVEASDISSRPKEPAFHSVNNIENISEIENFSPPSPDRSEEESKTVQHEEIINVDEIETLEKSDQIIDDKVETKVENGDDKQEHEQEIAPDDQLLNASIESENIDTALESAAQSILQIQDISDGEIFNSSIVVDNRADESTVMQLESADTSVLINDNNVTVDTEEIVDPVAVDNQDTNNDNDAEEVEVSILFTAELNKDLETLSLSNPDIEIYPVPADLSKDELVLEIRRYVAEEAQISLSRVSLVLHGKVIMHGMDVDDSFTAANASKLAKSGNLTVTIKSLNQAPPQQAPPVVAVPPIKQQSDTAPLEKVASNQAPFSRESLTMSHSELEKIVTEVKKQNNTRNSHDDLVAGHFHSTRTSLDNTLNSLSDTEGLTDEELAEKLSDLRQLKQKISPHIDDHHGSIIEVLGNLSNISEDNTSIEKRPDYLRLSLSNINRRSYDDDSLELPKFVDEPTNIKSNKSSSEIFTAKSKARSTVLESSESLAGAKRLDSVLNDDHDIKQSNNIFNRESNDGYSTQFDSLTSSNLYGTRENDAPDTKETNPKNSVNSWDSSNISDENFAVDLDKTIDSTVSGTADDVRMSSVLRKADEYERKASETSVNHTPVKDYKSASKASTPSIASPFDNLVRSEYKTTEKTIIEDFDGDDSLALSDDSRTDDIGTSSK